MAYGMFCPECTGTVDRNEFDFGKGLCKDCVAASERKQAEIDRVNRLLRTEFKQMELEDIISGN